MGHGGRRAAPQAREEEGLRQGVKEEGKRETGRPPWDSNRDCPRGGRQEEEPRLC